MTKKASLEMVLELRFDWYKDMSRVELAGGGRDSRCNSSYKG